MAFGELKIVPSADIGELGPKEGTAVVYNWKWYYSTPSLALWVVLVGAIVLVKVNRNPQALLILAPLLIVNLLWLVFKKVLDFSSADTEMFSMVFNSLVVGITVLWLLGHKLGNRNRFVTFILALAVLAVVGLVGAISYGMGFSQETAKVAIFLAVSAFTMLFAFVLAAWHCRRRYSSLRFMLCLPVWTIAMSIVSFLGYVVIALIIMSIAGHAPGNWSSMLLQVLVVGLVFGLVLGLFVYVINLPYMILAFYSPFFRERFYMCLRLKSTPTTPGQTDVDRPGDKSQDQETSESNPFV